MCADRLLYFPARTLVEVLTVLRAEPQPTELHLSAVAAAEVAMCVCHLASVSVLKLPKGATPVRRAPAVAPSQRGLRAGMASWEML